MQPSVALAAALALALPPPGGAAPFDHPTFHRDARRSGWNPVESALSPQALRAGRLGLAWESPPLDGFEGEAPRLYASPLYLDRVAIAAGAFRGTFSVVFAATNTGFVYAINASTRGEAAPGTILWRTRLGAPCRLQPAPLDGVATGVLSTPVIDPRRQRLYVTHCDPTNRWQAYALELGSGAVAEGWPVRLDEATLNRLNVNAGPTVLPPRRRFDFRVQRAALNLSPDGRWLYVGFGETETGWLAAVDTHAARVASAFATQAIPHRGSGGVWGAGGPAVDAAGHVYVVTGTGFGGFVDHAHDWTQSVLRLATDARGRLALTGTYTPFNHCATAAMDIDLGSGGASLVPGTDLVAVGGKQGNVYLLDGRRLPGRLDRRPPCGGDSASDASLLAPGPQPHLGARGPLNVFGPYSDRDAAMDLARSRSVPAAFRDAAGRVWLFVTGNTKKAEGSAESVPPSLARLEVVAGDGPPYLRVDRVERTVAFGNPGSPLVTSDGPREAVVWVLDENAPRSASLAGPGAPRPVLYAFDAATLELLWRSPAGALATSGKYNQPVVARGRVFVATDRIQAFALDARRPVPARGAEARAVEPAAQPPREARSGGADPAAIYAGRCAACHDHPQGSIPPREWIAARPRARIVEALTTGSMKPHAAGLATGDIDALAAHLAP